MTQEIFDQYGSAPLTLYKEWLSEAQTQEINDPDAVCLATSTPDGKPSARMLLIKDISDDGLKFHTNAESRKGEELSQNPYAALCIHWKSLRKQIRVEGKIEAVSDAESDAYFLTRPRARQIGAWASAQSRPYEKQQDLTDRLAQIERKYENQDIPRPPYWKGFRLIPHSLEFWIGQRDRVHTRFIYTLGDDGQWNATWLNP